MFYNMFQRLYTPRRLVWQLLVKVKFTTVGSLAFSVNVANSSSVRATLVLGTSFDGGDS